MDSSDATAPLPTQPRELVDHFFRHEYGRLVSLLTGWLGVRHLELVEDVVQMALWRALQQWSRRGVPTEPAAWLYRTARNLAIDHLRREAILHRLEGDSLSGLSSESIDYRVAAGSVDAVIADEPLRLLFLCCHPAIALESQIALALKIVGGFSVREIANGLLVSADTIEKRLTRAKQRLRDIGQELADLNAAELGSRVPAVLQVLYLMFNEGFSASSGDSLIKHDLCAEAIRLTTMLLAQEIEGSVPTAAALLALMLMHSSRFRTRIDSDQCIVLLADQDRTQWDWHKIRQAMHWMHSAARGDSLSRYHIEAAIAWEHSRAPTLAATDWTQVLQLYQLLLELSPGPMVRLNLNIAKSYAQGVQVGLEAMLSMSPEDRRQLRPWWDCALAQLLERAGQADRALSHWRDAWQLAHCSASREMIGKKVAAADSIRQQPHGHG